MIKAFSLDNEEAFRKILKKYNKNTMPYTGFKSEYMDDKVKKAHFVRSREAQILMDEIEDIYAENFEDGIKKIAAKKLRSKTETPGAHTGAAVRAAGLTIAGTIFAVQGLTEGLLDIDRRPRLNGDYVLQIYAGQFFPILLGLLFSLCVMIFQRTKVNHIFIFELEKRSALAWQQIAEIASWLMFSLGLNMYLNLNLRIGGPSMYVYWPVISVGLMVLIFVLPGLPYFNARMWLLATLARLFFSGLSRIGFGEFFVGDLLCSLTYTTGNIELFFCLYARMWSEKAACNSSHSRLLGLFSALPGIWRALQCMRRAGVPWSKDWQPNPHLYNVGKYCLTISQYVTLSIYRIDRSTASLVAFCIVAGLNSIYCICWDIIYDWSLATDYRKGVFPLREMLVYKRRWVYYAAMVIDTILRCNWVPYAIWTKDAQHSSFVSFLVALSEVLRRSMWVLFRIENEQASNNTLARAYEIRRLPYHLDDSPRTSESDQRPVPNIDGPVESVAAERQGASPMGTLQRLGSEIRQAHQKDYVKRKPKQWEGDSDDDDDYE